MSDPMQMPPIPEGEPGKEAKRDVGGGVLDTLDGLSHGIDATVLAVQAGSFALEAGATTLKVAVAGLEAVGSVLGDLADGT